MKNKNYKLNSSINKRITRNILRLLKQEGLTPEKLAFYSEVDKGNLSNLLAGKINYTIQTVNKLANGLSVDIHEFFVK